MVQINLFHKKYFGKLINTFSERKLQGDFFYFVKWYIC